MLQQPRRRISEDVLIIVFVPHSAPHEGRRPSSSPSTKDIKALKAYGTANKKRKTPCEPFSESDVKKVAQLKREVLRTGLILARHAEENALDKYESSIGVRGRKAVAKRKLVMYCIRINRAGDLAESKPCSHCVEVMKEYGIRKVVYSTKGGTLVTELLSTIESEPSVGYKSVDRAIRILDEMVNQFNGKP